MIRFKDGVPYGMWFSQHGFGEVCLWEDEACLSMQSDRVRYGSLVLWNTSLCAYFGAKSQLYTVLEAHTPTILRQGNVSPDFSSC